MLVRNVIVCCALTGMCLVGCAQPGQAPAGWKVAYVDQPIAWHQHRFTARQAWRRARDEGRAARLLGIDYRLGDAVADGLRLDIWLTLARQVRYGRVRTAADLLYPWLRPAAVHAGWRHPQRGGR